MKRMLIPLLLLLCLAMAGCAAEMEAAPSPSPSTSPLASPSADPSANPDMMPDGTDMADPMASPDNNLNMPDSGAAASAGVTTAAEARRVMNDLEAELVKLSEVTDAQVVVAGNVAAVAIETDSQYQGGVDDRIKTMVKERMDGIFTGIDRVAVTDDADLFDQLKSLGDRLDGEADMEEIRNELDAIMDKIQA